MIKFVAKDVIDEVEEFEFLERLSQYYKTEDHWKIGEYLQKDCLDVDKLEAMAGFHYISVKKLLLNLQFHFPEIFTLKYIRKIRKLKEILREESYS